MYKLQSKKIIIQNNQGQSLIEFVMLLVVLLSLSTVMYRGIKKGVTARWVAIIKVIASPNGENINIP